MRSAQLRAVKASPRHALSLPIPSSHREAKNARGASGYLRRPYAWLNTVPWLAVMVIRVVPACGIPKPLGPPESYLWGELDLG